MSLCCPICEADSRGCKCDQYRTYKNTPEDQPKVVDVLLESEDLNPNRFRYFDPEMGMTYNRKCPACDTDTWVQESIHTCYEGKEYHHNRINNKVVGVLHGIGAGEDTGVWCKPCYTKEFGNGTKE